MAIILLVSLLLGLLLQLTFQYIPSGNSDIFQFPLLLMMHYLIISALLRPVEISNGIRAVLRIDTLFYVFFYILFIFPYTSALLGFSDIESNRFIDAIFVEYSNKVVFVTAVFLLFFSWGVQRFATIQNLPNSASVFLDSDLRKAKFALNLSVVIFVFLIVALVFSGAISGLFAEYNGLVSGNTTADGIYFLVIHFSMLIMVFGVVLCIYEKRISPRTAISVIPALVWAFLLLFVGDRNSFLLILIIPVVGASTYFFRVRLIYLFAGCIVLFSIYQAVEVVRKNDVKNIETYIEEIFSDNSDDKGLSNSSFSLTTVTARASFADNPNGCPVFLGKFKLIGVMGVIPYSRSLFFLEDAGYLSSADYISDIVLGHDRTWSMGSNILSDLILDFGIFLLPISSFLIGGVAGFSMAMVRRSISFEHVSLYLMLCAYYSEYSRYSTDFPVRGIAWLLIFMWLINVYLRSKRF